MSAPATPPAPKSYSLRELPLSERPRERLRSLGAASLSTSELLAIVLGSGGPGRPVHRLAEALLAGAEGSLRRLALRPVAALTVVDGVGPARAVCVHAALELGRRLARAAIGTIHGTRCSVPT